MTYFVYKVKNYIVIADESVINKGEYGIAFAQGIKGVGRGYYLFKNDGSKVSWLNLQCEGTKKVLAHLPIDNSEVLESVDLLPNLPNNELEPIGFKWEYVSGHYNIEDCLNNSREIKKIKSGSNLQLVGKWIFEKY